MVDPLNHDIYVVTKKWNGWPRSSATRRRSRTRRAPTSSRPCGRLLSPVLVTAADFSPNGREIAIKGYDYSSLWPRVPGQAVGAALAAPSCQISHGPGETIAFAANGGGYFTIAEGRSKPLYWFGRS